MKLFPASQEQLQIINNIQNKNIIVNAVAGSGKTTTNLHIAKKYADKSILLLTYNKELKMESRKKTRCLNIKNLEVHSYHSFCVNYYYDKAYEDAGIIKLLNDLIKNKKKIKFDIILIDEIQDINALYYELVCKIFCDNEIEAKICLLGDIKQCINAWNHSDWRYIKFGEELFNFNDLEWERLTLSTSFRVTNNIAKFINNCMLNSRIINAPKIGNPVRYIICKCFGNKDKNRSFDEVKHYLHMGYEYEDFFILAPSVKAGSKFDSPIRLLANKLSANNIPIYVPNSDDEELDKMELKGKIVFSTFHQSKGRERKVVLVFNFDQSYFKYYGKELDPNVCPNELYVATTRAQEHLSLFHHFNNDYLSFLQNTQLHSNCFVDFDSELNIIKKTDKEYYDTAVTDLTRHLPSKIMKNCLNYITIVKENEKNKFINIPRKTKQGSLTESVSDITGIAIPSYFEYINSGKITIYKDIIFKSPPIQEYTFIDDEDDEDIFNKKKINKYDNIKLDNLKPDELLYISTRWHSYKSGYTFKKHQIKDFNWLTQEHLDNCILRLKSRISRKACYETSYDLDGETELHKRKLKAYFDCLENNVLWEFKCVKTIKKEHFLQLAIYMYIHKISQSNTNSNVMIGDIVKIRYSIAILLGKVSGFYNNKIYVTCGSRKIKINRNNIMENLTKRDKNTINNFEYKLYNILTDEVYNLSSELDNLKLMIDYLIKYKFYRNTKTSDNEFLISKKKIYNKYFEICNINL